MRIPWVSSSVLLFIQSAMTFAAVVDVRDDDALRRALSGARPGTQIRIAPGDYRPGVYASDLQGTADQPIVIAGADPQKPPVFEGGSTGWHLIDCAYVTLRNIAVRGQSGNGINIDDGGSYETPSHHIVLESLHVARIGPTGNRDGIKLSGVDDFVVRSCTVDGWAGQAIDMVGCHRGLITDCRFYGREGFSQTTGPQAKGGSAEIVIRRCLFLDAGQRAVNLGGSTGMAYFRPLGARYEARDITVEGCVFVGSMAPIAYVGVDGATVRYNTIYHPNKWVIRVLQETTAPGFPPCRNGRFEHNLVVFRAADVGVAVNIGPNTDPESFRFANNFWFCADRPRVSRPELPCQETDGVYGVDPDLEDPTRNLFCPRNAQAAKFGAHALPEAKR